ncbi:restriction endonuclease subunit S [Bizionia paragorgiae]|uniref:restriction endonuclease subunit S n=1 Tax=Bizionia paragorgiae TaxID=283786 RepID=UPI003A93C69C
MRKVRFQDMFEFAAKSKLKAGEGQKEGAFPFYTSSPIQSKFIDKQQFQGEHLIFGTGGSASVHFNDKQFAVSSDCFVLKPNYRNELFNTKYVFYYLLSNLHVLESGFRGAGLKHISKSYIANLSIPLPSYGEQNQIVTVLDKSYSILELRNKQLNQLELLKESLYFSLFSEKVKSYENWETYTIKDLALNKKGSMRTGPFGSNLKHDEFTTEGDIAVLGIDNAVNNYFEWGKRRFISKSKYDELKRYRIFPRDVIVTIMGTVGRSAVVPEDIPLAINTKHLAALTLNTKIANPYYIAFSIHSNPSIISQISQKNKGAVVPGINLTIIKNLKLKLPPIELQNYFEEFVCKVDNQIKAHLYDSRNQNDLLREVLSYNSFTGKLKTNLSAFSFDDQVVDYVEKEYVKNEYTNQSEQLKQLIQIYFEGRSFTFVEFNQLVKEGDVDIEYEYVLPEKRKGLRDFVFEALESDDTSPAFLKQVFEVDTNRDADKNKDESKIAFQINK